MAEPAEKEAKKKIGRVVEEAAELGIGGLLFYAIEKMVKKITEHGADRAAKAAVDYVAVEPARDRFTRIVYIKMPPSDTEHLRNWLRDDQANHIEDESVTLLCKLFEDADPPITDEELMAMFREIDNRGYRNFREILDRLRNDRIQQALQRCGNTAEEVARSAGRRIERWAGETATTATPHIRRWADALHERETQRRQRR